MFLGEARIPDGMVVYAVGDVHGHADLLEIMLDRIAADFEKSGADEKRIVMLGDYCDRGPASNQVYEMLSQAMQAGDMICLRGNHDQYILDFLEDPFEVGIQWLRVGGRETLQSYGVERSFELEPHQTARDFARALPRRHLDFINSTKFSHEIGDYFFVHAGVRPGRPLEKQHPDDLMWIRNTFRLHEGDFGKVVVHGHTPQEEVEIKRNRINADTGAFSSGVLSCIRLEGYQYAILRAIRSE